MYKDRSVSLRLSAGKAESDGIVSLSEFRELGGMGMISVHVQLVCL